MKGNCILVTLLLLLCAGTTLELSVIGKRNAENPSNATTPGTAQTTPGSAQTTPGPGPPTPKPDQSTPDPDQSSPDPDQSTPDQSTPVSDQSTPVPTSGHTDGSTIITLTTEPVKEGDPGLSPGAIAGITIGSLAGVAAVGGGVFGLLKFTGRI